MPWPRQRRRIGLWLYVALAAALIPGMSMLVERLRYKPPPPVEVIKVRVVNPDAK